LAVTRADVADWPSNGLEAVRGCPVCGGHERSVLYEDLTDRVFFTAPGRWTLHRCRDCGSAFLDPRPDRTTIGLAYETYYTHQETSPAPRPVAAGFRDRIRNGYLKARYGYDIGPANRLGSAIARLLPKRRWYADHAVRHLERKPGRRRLLDIGSGNGDFLRGMQQQGWEVQGLEPDTAAADAARQGGVPVISAPLQEASLETGSFDAVTLNHVIEHFHDPADALRICRQVLAPCGTLWLATPNLEAWGHARYGRDWLGLDPPRHLVVFTREALVRAVEQAGFAVRALPVPYMTYPSFPISAAVAAGRDPAHASVDLRMRARIVATDFLVRFRPQRAEEIVLIAEAV
jgi:SAM-dependent methyltransferase